MKIRQASSDDIAALVEIDRKSFGETGATKEFFLERLSLFPQGVLVSQEQGRITGFSIITLIEKDEIPLSFSSLKLDLPLRGKSMFSIAFTTQGNYLDKANDAKLLREAEYVAKRNGCVEAFVELSKDHPHASNGAYEFWEANGYKKCGTINWEGPMGVIPCYLLRKNLE